MMRLYLVFGGGSCRLIAATAHGRSPDQTL